MWNLAQSGTFSGCFYINNNTELVSFFCKESTGNYPKVSNCFSKFFDHPSRDENRSALKLVKISECKGSDLNRKLYRTFTNLREFDISFYGVQSLNSDTLTLKYLEKLNASHNKLTNIGGSIFYNSPNVMDVDFSYNKITKLFPSDFLHATRMSTMNFSHNEIFILGAETFRNLTELTTLDLSHNLIKTVDESQFNDNLVVLSLENNPIIRLDCKMLEFLMRSVQVEFPRANVKEIDKSCLKNSIKIELNSNNDFVFRRNNSELAFAKQYIENLQIFNIAGNQLQNTPKIIELLGTSIETLDVSSNFIGKLSTETLKKFENLLYLNLSQTNLSNFGFNTFYNQRRLLSLDLSYNHMKKVDFTLFVRNFRTLETLNLEGNDLNEVTNLTRVRFPKLVSLGLSKNHFSCHYLANFLLSWENLTLFDNPSDQTHIDGVDCYHEEENSKENQSHEAAMDMESSDEDGKSTDTGVPLEKASTAMVETETGEYQTQNSKMVGESGSTGLRVVELVLLCLCIACCGFLVLKKTNAIEGIRQRLAERSLDQNIGYQREERGSQDLSFIYSGITTL
ncbi:toll-like receptor 3 [Sitodiplosis mosellana]|uniref:toll-like receptor 3 n=1 Tax=Sitodiplosis mosellana TaxID=263140 RepID=UPI0024442B8F|nr:toll-like receptor 3 [Sitodiplosis mosellana]